MAWGQVNAIQSWCLCEITVHSRFPIYFSFHFPTVQQKGTLESALSATAKLYCSGPNIWRSRHWEGLATCKSIPTIILQSKNGGKWGRQGSGRAAAEKPQPSQELWALGLHPAPDGLKTPSYFPNAPTSMPFWEYLLICAKKKLTLAF